EKLNAMQPEDLAVVFFAGHGAKLAVTDETTLVTGEVLAKNDGVDARSLEQTGLKWSSLGASLERLPGRVLVLLDACHSGHFTQELIVPNGAMVSELSRRGRAGVVVFAASKGKQVSWEGSASRGFVFLRRGSSSVVTPTPHGYFTGAFVKALES